MCAVLFQSIMKNIVSKYCDKFTKKYLTFDKLITLSKRERTFHFNGQWGILEVNEKIEYRYYNGGNGNVEHIISSCEKSDCDNVIFIPFENSFILFVYDKKHGFLRTEYQSSVITEYSEKAKFLNDNGIKVKRKVMSLNKNMLLEFNLVDAF